MTSPVWRLCRRWGEGNYSRRFTSSYVKDFREPDKQTVKLSLDTRLSNLGKGLDLLDVDDWSGTLYVQVAEHFEFPIALFGDQP